MKTLEKVPVVVKYVDEQPFENLERGVLYVSKKKMHFSHRCLCECARFVNIPIQRLECDGVVETSGNQGWNMTIKDGKVTVSPSLLNNPCKCHYIITNGVANIV